MSAPKTQDEASYPAKLAYRKGSTDVRFGSKADICAAKSHVGFTPKSRHVQCTSLCLLWAISGPAAAALEGAGCLVFLATASPLSRPTQRPSPEPHATGSVPRFGEISQIFRIGFRTRGHARNKLSIVPCRIGQGLCLCRRPLMSGPSVNYRHLGGSEHKHG